VASSSFEVWWVWLLVIFFGITDFARGSGVGSSTDQFKELPVQVVDEGGFPVVGIRIELRGLERDAVHGSLLTPETVYDHEHNYEGWTFTTDSEGSFIARLGRFKSYEHEKIAGVFAPGFGEFYFVTEMKARYAGGVSPRILNIDPELREFYRRDPERRYDIHIGEEWLGYDGERTRVFDENTPDDSSPLTIVLRHGINVFGQLVNSKNRPIKGETVSVWTDLGADTHTGRGGEIFCQSVETDRTGRFQFHNVFPNLFYLELGGEDSSTDDALYWIRTRVRQRWIDGIADAIWPHIDETEVPIVIVADNEPPFRYGGQVTDDDGKPIKGATVRIQASLHGCGGRTDFEDDHDHHSQARTNAKGRYDVPAAAPFVNWFEISAPGFKTEYYGEDGEIRGVGLYEEVPCAPGRYDFVLRRVKR
jgi:uncharacterized GH25 family protein